MEYSDNITLIKNKRGCYDFDTSKGCSYGMANNTRGCYNDCYAFRVAHRYGIDFSKTVLRNFKSRKHEQNIIKQINKIDMPFIRMGVSGDPSDNWQHTLDICLWNWNTELWECAWDIQDSSYYEIISGSVFSSTNYISGGIVQMKYDHVGNGITSHVFYIDYVALSSGISAITSNEHDALSGRDDILHNHPNIIEVFYNQSQVNDSIDEKTKEFTKNSTDLTALNINANNLSVSQTSYTDGVWTYGYDDTSGFHIKMYINDIGRGVIQSEGELVLSSGTSLDNVYLNSSSSIYIDLGDNLADKVYIRNSGGSIGASLASTGNLDLISGDFTTTGDITTTGSAEIGIRTGYANPTQLIVHTGELWSLDEGNLISFPDIYPSLTMKAIGYEEGLSATRWTIENGAYSGALSVSDIDSYGLSGQSTLQIGNSGEVVGGDFGLDLTLHYPDQDFSNTLINSNTTITGYTFLEKDLNVEGDALFEQNVSVLGNLSVGENTLMIDSSNMHMIATGNTPSLSCGSGGSIVGTDMAGKITCGDEPDPCTITFSAPYSVAPACVISGNINPMSSYVEVTTTTTTMVISPYQDISGDVISYICIGLG